MTGAALDLREVFATPWTGTATIWRPWWLRWVPLLPTGFEFRTVAVPEGTGVLVHDTQTFPNGQVWERTMRGELLSPGRWQMTAEDMPGGTEITVGPDGYAFSPYTIRVPILGPVTVPLKGYDEVRFIDATSLEDTIELRFRGVRVGRVSMRLRRSG